MKSCAGPELVIQQIVHFESGLCPLTAALVVAPSCKLNFANWAFLPFADLAEPVLARIRKAALGLRAETDKCVVPAYLAAPENPEM